MNSVDYYRNINNNFLFRLETTLQKQNKTTETMNNIFIKCLDKSHAERIVDFYNTMGIDFDRGPSELIPRNYSGVYCEHSYKNLFPSIIENNSTYRQVEIPNKDSFHNFSENTFYLCRTRKIAEKLLEVAEKRGYKWKSGEQFSRVNMWGQYEENTVYDMFEGTFGDFTKIKEEGKIKIMSAEEFLYGIKDLEARELNSSKECELIPFEELVKNKWYTYHDSNREVNFKFEGQKTDIDLYKYVNGYSRVKHERIFYCKHLEEVKITTCSKQDLKKVKKLYREWNKKQIIKNNAIRESKIRKKFSKIKSLPNYKVHNRTKKTQLLSSSFHECLYKIRQESKIARSLMKINNLGYDSSSIRNLYIRKSSKDKPLTFCPQGKETIMTENGNWEIKGRQQGKYGKLIRKILKEQVPNLKYTDQDIEKLVNHIKAYYSDGEFKIVEGEDIRNWYHYENYSEDSGGTLSDSCMRRSENQSFLDIYVENPDTIKMIILIEQGKLMGRALLWDNLWMDRIYGTDSVITAFINYAKEKGYNCKSEQNSDCIDEWKSPKGKSFYKDLTFQIKTDFDQYPYADTFFYLDKEGGEISNSDLSTNCELRETDGSLLEEKEVYDEIDEVYISEEYSVYINCVEGYTHIDNATRCDWDNEYYHSERMVETLCGSIVYENSYSLIEVEGGYCHEDDHYICEFSDKLFHEDANPSVHLPELDMTVMQDYVSECYEKYNYVEVNGSWVEESKTEESI